VDDLRALYEDRAAQQYAEAGPLPDPRIDRKFARICTLVREHLPCEAFLDAGCGDGRYLAALAVELPARKAGLDISERILETARHRVDADFRQGNLEAIPFADGEFDLVLSSQVIEHVLHPDAAVRELARVLRPTGTLIISTDNARSYVSKTINAPRTAVVRALGLRGVRGRVESPAVSYTDRAFRELLERGGFAVERVETFRFHLMWPLDLGPLTRALNAVESRVHTHFGDIVVAVAHR
jgi:ubiquinone/menaquinone biosynthesis C-methylase UbiE